jgi:hypothetical protein
VRRAQEALGVLMAAMVRSTRPKNRLRRRKRNDQTPGCRRPDVRLFTANERAADRVWRDSVKDFFPVGLAVFDPQSLTPAGVFATPRSWRFVVSFSQPVFDGGQRRIEAARESRSPRRVRAAGTAGAGTLRRCGSHGDRPHAERALPACDRPPEQANGVLTIVNVAFEAGATTNLEVIDAQREDAESRPPSPKTRLPRLDLLTALGRFRSRRYRGGDLGEVVRVQCVYV